jgi:uncharacterized membrane protein
MSLNAFTGNMHYSELQFVSVLLSAVQTTQLDEWERIWKDINNGLPGLKTQCSGLMDDK